MNFECAVLRSVNPCRKQLKELKRHYARLAACPAISGVSYDAVTFFQKFIDKMEEIDLYYNFLGIVEEALKQLSPVHRRLLYATYIKDISREEVAAKSNVSKATVYRQLTLARKRFKRELEKMGCTKEWLLENFGDLEVPDMSSVGYALPLRDSADN